MRGQICLGWRLPPSSMARCSSFSSSHSPEIKAVVVEHKTHTKGVTWMKAGSGHTPRAAKDHRIWKRDGRIEVSPSHAIRPEGVLPSPNLLQILHFNTRTHIGHSLGLQRVNDAQRMQSACTGTCVWMSVPPRRVSGERMPPWGPDVTDVLPTWHSTLWTETLNHSVKPVAMVMPFLGFH